MRENHGNLAFKFNFFWFLLLIIGILITASLIIYASTYESRSIYTAKQLLKNYRNKEAIRLLENVRLQNKKNNPELNFTLFYAYIRENQFSKAKKLLNKLEALSTENQAYFQDISNQLVEHDEEKFLFELLKKSKALELKETYFISLSQLENSLGAETVILEKGMKYLFKDKNAVRRLKEYLLKRLLETEADLENDKDHARSIKYLEKARKLAIEIQNEDFEADIYYKLGKNYLDLKDTAKAKEYLDLSAKISEAASSDASQ